MEHCKDLTSCELHLDFLHRVIAECDHAVVRLEAASMQLALQLGVVKDHPLRATKTLCRAVELVARRQIPLFGFGRDAGTETLLAHPT